MTYKTSNKGYVRSMRAISGTRPNISFFITSSLLVISDACIFAASFARTLSSSACGMPLVDFAAGLTADTADAGEAEGVPAELTVAADDTLGDGEGEGELTASAARAFCTCNEYIE